MFEESKEEKNLSPLCQSRKEASDPPACALRFAHKDTVQAVRDGMPESAALYALSEFYKVFGDPTRIRILHALLASELCVCDIAALLDMSFSAISHQLRILKQARLVRFRREGKTVFYALADAHVRTILEMGQEHIFEV